LSTLTKVFALLVSALAIFLCGVVVTFITNTQDWQLAYQDQKTLAEAAQVQAVAAEMELSRALERYKLMIEKLQDSIVAVQQLNGDLSRQLAIARQTGANEASRAETAVQTMQALRETIQNMYEAQLELQDALDEDRSKMIAAQTQMIELTRQLNSERAMKEQLESIRRRYRERINELEEENVTLRQKVTLTASEFEAGGQVALTTPEKAGVPIRGQIMQVDGQRAAISVGSASGVRKDMKFAVVRGGKFLGNIEITYVEPSESVGRVLNPQGVIVEGDSVTSGFD